MADFRTVKTSMWAQDEWFMDLPTDGKLLWVYLFTNAHTSVAGIYRLPLRTMEFESGLPRQRITELLQLFERSGKAYYGDGVIWVVKMREHQATGSHKVEQRIKSDVESLPDIPLRKSYLAKYPIDTL